MDLIAVAANLVALHPDGSFGPISCMIKHINMLDQVPLTFIKAQARQKSKKESYLSVKLISLTSTQQSSNIKMTTKCIGPNVFGR